MFPLHNRVNQLYVDMYPFPLKPPCALIPPIRVITDHPAESPVRFSSFPSPVCLTHGGVFMSVLLSQFVPLLFFPAGVHKSVPYICVYIPAL